MAYYRRRRGGYRRRRNPVGLLKIIAVLLVVVVCAAAVVQTKRLRDANETIERLQKQAQGTGAPAGSAGNAAAPEGQKPETGALLSYQKLYPEMKTQSPERFSAGDSKAVYLTFDDGPSVRTADILDALRDKNQRATFFVVGKNIAGNENLLKRMANEGHTIGIHGFSHDYAATYASVDVFLEDFHQAYQAVYEACGVYPAVFRFPGGSVNAYNRMIYQPLIAEMLRRGFVYYDWNVSAEDATGKAFRPAQLVQTVTAGLAQNSHAIVLLHDAADKKATAQAVPLLLDQLSALGYYADRLDASIQPVTFGYSE